MVDLLLLALAIHSPCRIAFITHIYLIREAKLTDKELMCELIFAVLIVSFGPGGVQPTMTYRGFPIATYFWEKYQYRTRWSTNNSWRIVRYIYESIIHLRSNDHKFYTVTVLLKCPKTGSSFEKITVQISMGGGIKWINGAPGLRSPLLLWRRSSETGAILRYDRRKCIIAGKGY